MDYLISQMPWIAALFVAFVVFAIMERFHQFEPFSITFKSPKTEVVIAIILYLALAALSVFVFWQATSRTVPETEPAPVSYTLTQALLQLLANAIIFLPFGIVMLVRKQGLKTVGISRTNLTVSILGCLVVGLITSLIFGRLSLGFWLSASTIFRLIAQLGVGFSEEAIFRGYLLLRFSAYFKRNTAEVLTALMFAFIHIPQRLFNKPTLTELVIDLVVLFLWGWVFNVIMRRTKNISGLAILHAVMNVVGT